MSSVSSMMMTMMKSSLSTVSLGFQGIRMDWKSVKDKSREKLHLISFAVQSLNANLVTTS